MAQIIFTIPDDKLARVIDAVAAYYGWTAETGLTKAAFAKGQLVNFLKQIVWKMELQNAVKTAERSAEGGFIDPEIT